MFDVKIDLGDFLEYLTEKALAEVKDSGLSEIDVNELLALIRRSAATAGSVQCIGMNQPLPLKAVYQPTDLIDNHGCRVSSKSLFTTTNDFIIRGGPGDGKTTLLHWLYVSLVENCKAYPLLFTLRRRQDLEMLPKIAKQAFSGDLSKHLGNNTVVFLVDGYDEISKNDKTIVAATLLELAASKRFRFVLTCRTFYDVHGIPAHHLRIGPFDDERAINYIDSFSKFYGRDIDSGELVATLKDRGFEDFLFHPLMLTLVCILKADPDSVIPRETVKLVRNAIQVLSLKWDYEKGVERQSRFPFDSEDRLNCLTNIAFQALHPEVSESSALNCTTSFFRLAGHTTESPKSFLMEIAQWYGIFVPSGEGEWKFTHRTIHDFLAARYMVEKGLFKPHEIQKWTTRAAYAAALSHNATDAIDYALRQSDGLPLVIEILSNAAPYRTDQVAESMQLHLSKYGVFEVERTDASIIVSTPNDFFGILRNDLLQQLARDTAGRIFVNRRYYEGHDRDPDFFIFSYCFAELHKRGSLELIQKQMERIEKIIGSNISIRVARNNGQFARRLSQE